ncbi:glycosyltransferase family 4 protein [Rhodococcus sp. IEGM 1330]|uniref:glycosyltransferase family 4 protein n=1 Tax=Rhodococcus sp. IEGM 1330 TaxID=3082225 RepID=UPI002953E250|nr:glycosyltransferase family 4 protein [Rhodococcus sp. IEGM 1330]MDV8023654.1 glycosyltransferase family 4 protein [Rhodococcus sp. IEGM 1330]
MPEDVKARSIQARTFDLCFVGRLEEEKGVRIALDVAESMNVAAVVIGDGSLRSEVQERSRKSDGQIRYMGALSYVDTMRTLADTKLVLVPSAWDEPFGRVAAEALAVGALPLVSNRGGLPEIVAGLDYSAVVDTFSTDAWILAASSLLSVGDADMEILSHSAIGHWKALFSEEALAAKLVEVYRVVTGKSSVGKTYE